MTKLFTPTVRVSRLVLVLAAAASGVGSVAFESEATNLVPRDNNGRLGIFVHDQG
ncbi:MAG: hypothetical protein M3042_12485 [Actinomycetota bacterium]|nr:hypothetical protein [Actinomycetota bacterium]